MDDWKGGRITPILLVIYMKKISILCLSVNHNETLSYFVLLSNCFMHV